MMTTPNSEAVLNFFNTTPETVGPATGFLPTLIADFYKLSHRELYPDGTEEISSL